LVMKKSAKLYCLLLLFFNCHFLSAQQEKKFTIAELFLKIPEKFLRYDTEFRKNILSDTDTRRTIIDNKNGYLSFEAPDNPFEDFELCVFKIKTGGYLLAYSYRGDRAPYEESGDIESILFFQCFQFKNNKWSDITKSILPVKYNNTNIYKLPRYGKKIFVSNKNGKPLYTLDWKGAVFSKG
jgi:hypothetical protein